MNLKSIKYFLITAEEMNFTRAAERLYISQQALSSHIQRLEAEYHVQLFQRKPVLRLTPEGEQMVFYGKRIRDADRNMQAAFSDISVNCRGTLRIGIPRLRSNVFFPDMWKYYHPAHPNISIELMDGRSIYLDELLQAGKLDLYLGVNVPANSGQYQIELAKESIHCCFSKELLMRYYPDTWQQLLKRFREEGVDLEHIIRLPFSTLRQGNKLRNELETFFSTHQKPDIVFECDQQELIYDFAKSGGGAGLLSPILFYQYRRELSQLKDTFFVFPLNSTLPESRISLVYQKNYTLPRYAVEFVQVACMVMRNYSNFIYTA